MISKCSLVSMLRRHESRDPVCSSQPVLLPLYLSVCLSLSLSLHPSVSQPDCLAVLLRLHSQTDRQTDSHVQLNVPLSTVHDMRHAVTAVNNLTALQTSSEQSQGFHSSSSADSAASAAASLISESDLTDLETGTDTSGRRLLQKADRHSANAGKVQADPARVPGKSCQFAKTHELIHLVSRF